MSASKTVGAVNRRRFLGLAGMAGLTAASASRPAKVVAQTPARPTTTVTWFAVRDVSGYSQKQVDAFNALNRGIHVEYQEQGANTTDLKDKFTTVSSAKDSSVDIVSVDAPFMAEYAAAGWALQLDDVFPAAERAQFYPGTIDGVSYQGKLYAIPWYNNGPGLFYRTDLFKAAGLQPPKTYADMIAAGKKLQTPTVAGLLTLVSQSEQGVITWMEYLWGAGGDVMDNNLNVVVDKDSRGADALQMMLDLVYKDKILPEFTVQAPNTQETVFPFRDGKGAMIRGWFTGVVQYNSKTSSAILGKWDVAPLPSKDGAKPGPGCLGSWDLAVSKFSKKQKEAIEVIKYFTSQEQQRARVMGNGNLPTRTAIFDDAEVRANYPYIDGLKQSLVQLKPRPVTPFYGQMSSNVLQPNIGAVMTRQKSPQQAIKDIAAGLRQIQGS